MAKGGKTKESNGLEERVEEKRRRVGFLELRG